MASSDMMIIVMMMMMSSVFSIIAGGAFFLNKPEEGDTCKGPSVGGNYVIDEDGKCVIDYCDSGYTKSGGGCVVDTGAGAGAGTGGEDAGADTGTGSGNFVYEFIANVHNEDSLRLHLADIKLDGVRPNESQVDIKISPNGYKCDSKTNDCVTTETLGYIDAAGDMTWTAWDEEGGAVYNVGDIIFTVTSPTKVSEFQISYQRPKYAPGWIIRENGNIVLTETENKGNSASPTPVTYTYTLNDNGNGSVSEGVAGDPTCSLQREEEVFQCSDYVYQTRANAQQQCGNFGSTITPMPFIWDDTEGSACGIKRTNLVYSGCGYIYQKESDATRQCGNVSRTYQFIPAE